MNSKPLKRSDAIDGIRAIACMIVLIFHALAEHLPDFLWLLTGTARIGVWLFFTLSAYLLTHKILKAGDTLRYLPRYAIERVLRIYPPFLVAVAVYLAIGQIGITPDNVLMVAILQVPAGHLWTIPPEMAFYALLPILIVGMSIVPSKSRLWPIALLAVVALLCALIWPPIIAIYDLGHLLPCFLVGVAAAYLSEKFARPSEVAAFWMAATSIVAVVAFTIAMKSGVWTEPRSALVDKYAIYSVMWAIFIYSAHGYRHKISEALSWRPLSLFGRTIFSTYLFHWMFMEWIARLPYWWAVPVSIACSIAVGAISFAVLEKPLDRLRFYLSSRI